MINITKDKLILILSSPFLLIWIIYANILSILITLTERDIIYYYLEKNKL